MADASQHSVGGVPKVGREEYKETLAPVRSVTPIGFGRFA
jgi:hypothetical protein